MDYFIEQNCLSAQLCKYQEMFTFSHSSDICICDIEIRACMAQLMENSLLKGKLWYAVATEAAAIASAATAANVSCSLCHSFVFCSRPDIVGHDCVAGS